jgi:hypothetical protein
MNVSLDRLTRILGELERLLGSKVVRNLLRQFPFAEAAYFLAQQKSVKQLVARARVKLPSVMKAGPEWRELAEVSLEMRKVQKSLVAVSKPDDIRAFMRQISNLGFELENQVEFVGFEATQTNFPRSPEHAPRRRTQSRSGKEMIVRVPAGLRVEEPESAATWGLILRPPMTPVPSETEYETTETQRRVSEMTTEGTPRYANAALLDLRSRRLLDRQASLEPGHVVRLRLDIGKLSPESQVNKTAPFPDRQLPKDVNLDVMVSSTDFAVRSSAKAAEDTSPTVAHGRFFLPGDGKAATTPAGRKYLSFYLTTPDEACRAHGRIGYYFRNVLIQSQHLVATVGKPGGFKIETDFTLSEDLTNLQNIPERPRVSILTNSNGDGMDQIVLRRPDSPASGGERGATFHVNATNLGNTIKNLRKALALRAPTDKRRSGANLVADLRQLAPLGWSLFTQLAAQCFDTLQPALDNPDSFVIQVLRPTTSGFVFPWAFVYGIPLESGQKPSVCPLLSRWDEAKPLFTGSPRSCPEDHPSINVLCPFGFWGFRYTIEQLSTSDKLVFTIPAAPTCKFVVAETQYNVNIRSLADHITTLREMLAKASAQAQLLEGKDRAKIKELLGQDLPLVYFYCHGERLNVGDPNTWLGVGKNETITSEDFIGWVVEWQRSLKKRYWNDVRPLVFINACHSLAVEPETLVSYLDAFVGTGHAAGVIGTEVKVDQRLAMNVAQQFFGYLLGGNHTVESALRAIRLDYLASGNLLGLVYTPYCWADLRLNSQLKATPIVATGEQSDARI